MPPRKRTLDVGGNQPPPTSRRVTRTATAAHLYSRQSLVLAFAACAASARQRNASEAGRMPIDLHQIILGYLPLTPEYGCIRGLVGTVGNGVDAGELQQVSFAPDGTLLAVDLAGHLVHHFKQSGELIKTFGTGLSRPVGACVSRLRASVFVSDVGTDCIHEFELASGESVRILMTPGLQCPWGMCLSPDEVTLVVACGIPCNLYAIRLDGSEAPRTIGGRSYQGGKGEGQFYYPRDVSFTPDGQQLVVADRDNNRIQVLNYNDGSFVRSLNLNDPVGNVVVDAGGAIVATTNKHVKVFSPQGMLVHDRLGGLVMGKGLNAQGGLAIDPTSGMIAVGDHVTGELHLL